MDTAETSAQGHLLGPVHRRTQDRDTGVLDSDPDLFSLTSAKPLKLLGPQLSLLQNQMLVPDYGLARGREISSAQCK